MNPGETVPTFPRIRENSLAPVMPRPSAKLDASVVTGAVQEQPKQASRETASKEGMAKKEAAKPTAPEGRVSHPEEAPRTVSPSERAILERLQSRRQELEARAREIDIRETLLKAAEKRVESRVEELKAVEARAANESQKKSEAENARFKGHRPCQVARHHLRSARCVAGDER